MLFDFMIMEYILNCVLLKYSILLFLFFVSSQTIEFDIIHYKLKNTLMSFLIQTCFPFSISYLNLHCWRISHALTVVKQVLVSCLSFFLSILSRSNFDHHLRCGGWLNFEFS